VGVSDVGIIFLLWVGNDVTVILVREYVGNSVNGPLDGNTVGLSTGIIEDFILILVGGEVGNFVDISVDGYTVRFLVGNNVTISVDGNTVGILAGNDVMFLLMVGI